MTIAHVASDPHLTPIQHDPAAADARCMQQLRTRDASDHLAMYQAGFYVTSDRQTGEFYWFRGSPTLAFAVS